MAKLFLYGYVTILVLLAWGGLALAAETKDSQTIKSGDLMKQLQGGETQPAQPQPAKPQAPAPAQTQPQAQKPAQGQAGGQADIVKSLTSAGAQYQPSGFPGFPKTPFQRHQRVKSVQLDGAVIYATHDGYRIFKYLNCGPQGVVYLELAIMDRANHRVPFAWQDCGGDCQNGADCKPSNPLYIDLTGDGVPDIKVPQVGSIYRMSRVDLNAWNMPLYTFTTTVVPEWVWTKMGPDRRDECLIRPDDRVDPNIDHPLTVQAQASKDLKIVPKGQKK